MTHPIVKLDSIAFDGPFDLLFSLIEKKEYDIYDIPISELTDQYIEYIETMNVYDMDNMSEFVLMASTLLEIKSRMLIPRPVIDKPEDEVDPRTELVMRLVEYKRFKDITEELRNKEEDAARRFFRLADASLRDMVRHINLNMGADIGELLRDVTLDGLFKVFEDVVSRRELAPGNEMEITQAEGDNITIESKITHINELLRKNFRVSFASIFDKCSSKIEKVVTFLAVLELIRQLKIKIEQERIFDEIYISTNLVSQNETF